MWGISGTVWFGGATSSQPDAPRLTGHRPSDASVERCLGKAVFRSTNRPNSHLHASLASSDRYLIALLCEANNAPQISYVEALSRSVVAAGDEWVREIEAIAGDFVFAIWDNVAERLHLGRPLLSQQSLFYRREQDAFRFSSLAPTLSDRGAFDLKRLADLRQPGMPKLGSSRTAFENVSAVLPGNVLSVDQAKAETQMRFAFAAQNEGLGDGEAAERLRVLLTESVGRAVAGADAPVASQLSGGRDSGAVTVTAAALMSETGRDVLALTSAPAESFCGRHDRYFYDEAENAKNVAAAFPNIRHRVVRAEKFDLCQNLDARHAVMAMPVMAPTNIAWWDALERSAKQDGATLLLTGICGNFTISAGGPWGLNDLLPQSGVSSWVRQMRDCLDAPGSSVASLLNMSFGGRMPRGIYNLLQSRRHGNPDGTDDRYLRGDLAAVRRAAATFDDLRPPKSFRSHLSHALHTADFSDPAGMFLNGVTLRDPTADRRLAELALSLSAEQLACRHDRRPIFDAAFADLLPDTTLRPTAKGAQGGDWNFAISPDAIAAGLDRYAQSARVNELIDLEALSRVLRDWPTDPVVESRIEQHFLTEFLPTICMASFIYVHSDR